MAKRQLDFERFLDAAPVFSLAALAAARQQPDDTGAARDQLKYHLRRGRVKAVAREIYAAVPRGVEAGRFVPDRHLVAAAALPDGVFSYHVAWELRGASHTLWNECTMHAPRRRASIQVGAATVRFLAVPTAVRRARAETLGVVAIEHEGCRLQVTGPERTIVEGFRRPARVGGLEEHVTCATGVAILDFATLEAVLSVYDERSTWAAVGWLVETHRDQWLPPDEFMRRCRAERPRGSQSLLRNQRKGRLLRGWNLIVPEALLREFEGHAADS